SAKLSPVLPDIPGMALVARDAGVDAITVVNTLPGLLLAEAGRAPRLGNGNGGVSGPVLLPVGVLAAARVVERTGGMPVIGVGGVRSASDVRQYLRVGASLVGIGAAARALGVAMATVHTLGGGAMMEAAAMAAGGRVGLVGVTVLTSHDPASFARAVGRARVDLAREVERLSAEAVRAGLAGVVCSP